MPVYSMTGYATASAEAAAADADSGVKTASGAGVTVELRSVNSRFLDLSFRMPDELRGLEPGLRELLTGALRRGKVEMRVATAREADTAWPQPQTEQLARLERLQSQVTTWLTDARPLSVNEALNWCRGGGQTVRLDDALMDAAKRAVKAMKQARGREGQRLVGILMERITRLRELAEQAEPLVPAVVQRQQERFLERWKAALEQAATTATVSADAQQDRALNEAAAYALRIDVAEELSRLRAHLDEITRLLEAGGELGKRLDFLIQELHREANTLGSKSAALELTNVSVEMKVAIEQMREQVQNIE